MNDEILKEGYIFDYITSKQVNYSRPEEKVRQEYEHVLIDDYYYAKSQCDIEYPIKIGSSTKYADIVIFRDVHSNKKQYLDVLCIVETKSKNRKDGVEQLTSYMQATSCIFGVWTNGIEIVYLLKTADGQVKDDILFNLPKKDESIDDIGRLDKKKLKPVNNLKPIFRRILNALYANTNISRREKLGNEMVKLLFSKIYDEKYDLDSLPEFRITSDEIENRKFDDVKNRVSKLFAKVKAEFSEDDIFLSTEEIVLDARSVAYVVGELSHISLLKTSKDVVGEAFETFAESKLVGEKGEFFTPREVVRVAIKLLDPSPDETICDPACGSGGFLIYALEHMWHKMENDRKYRGSQELSDAKKRMAEKCFYGIDKETDLVKICKAYMTIVGDGKSRIVQENSLHSPDEFNSKAKEYFTHSSCGETEFKRFDYVVTNPPFGSKIKIHKEDARDYLLGHVWKYDNHLNKWVMTTKIRDTAPQELFIERCMQMLKDGGKLAIILPDTYLHAPSKKHVLQFILEGNNLQAVVDLPHNTFRPYCNAKTCLIILEKGVKQQDNIIMAVAEQIGHDHKGDVMYRFDSETKLLTMQIWDDTKNIISELDNPSFSENHNVFVQPFSQIKDNLFVPKFYWNSDFKMFEDKYDYVSIKRLISDGVISVRKGYGSPKSGYKGKGTIPFVKVDDIMSWEIYKNPSSAIPESIYYKLMRNKYSLKEGDIIFVKEGSYRIGSVAMLSKNETKIYLNHHSLVFRIEKNDNSYGIDSFYLLYLLSCEQVQKQIPNKIMIDTTLPNIGNRWENILLPIDKNLETKREISWRIKEIMAKKWESQLLTLDFENKFGKLTT